MKMYTDPRDEVYRQIIDLAMRNSDFFVLSDKITPDIPRERYSIERLLHALEPYRMKTLVIPDDRVMEELMQVRAVYQSHTFYSSGTYYLYRNCEESAAILKQSANRLADWIFPELPEDLCFVKENGGDYLYSVVHKQMYAPSNTGPISCISAGTA